MFHYMDINTDEGNAPSDNRTVEKSTISKQADSETVHSCNSHQLSTLASGSPSMQGPVPHYSSLQAGISLQDLQETCSSLVTAQDSAQVYF